MNNISFKGVFFFPSLDNLAEKEKKKLDVTINHGERFFPNNDIFIGSDEDKSMTVQVMKRNPLWPLLKDDDLFKRMNVSEEEMTTLVNLSAYMKSAHEEIWGLDPDVVIDTIKNPDKKSPVEILGEIKNAVKEFNDRFMDKPN